MNEKLIEFAQSMIDELCERDGIFATIERLHEFGFTKFELTHYLRFDPNDVEEVLPSEE